MSALDLIPGRRRGGPSRQAPVAEAIANAVHAAKAGGFQVGRAVAVGAIPGRVIGYNIASYGRYIGSHYPLLVETEFGIIKSHPEELTLL